MESMSHDPAAGEIGSQLVDIASRGMSSVAAAAMSLTGLAPAGGEEVSMQAAMAFAAEGAAMQASHNVAQEELARTGAALMNIARAYSRVDSDAAGSLVSGAGRPEPLAGGTGTAGLMRAETPLGTGGSVARPPLVAPSIGEGAPPARSAPVSGIANAASSAVGTGIASLGSIGQGGAAGASAGPALASASGEDEEETRTDGDPTPGERLL